MRIMYFMYLLIGLIGIATACVAIAKPVDSTAIYILSLIQGVLGFTILFAMFRIRQIDNDDLS